MQIPRTVTHQRARAKPRPAGSLRFDYGLEYRRLNLRTKPELYRVGVGEQGVLLVEPYKSEILPHWKFRTPALARRSAAKIFRLFLRYKANQDFVGMDMARKFLQMGYTRSRRYANHRSGRKYSSGGLLLPFENDDDKAAAARIFRVHWRRAEADPDYQMLKVFWRGTYG